MTDKLTPAPNRDPVHDLIAACVVELGKRGADPVHIRCALAINLVNLCKAERKLPVAEATRVAVFAVEQAGEVLIARGK